MENVLIGKQEGHPPGKNHCHAFSKAPFQNNWRKKIKGKHALGSPEKNSY